MGQKGLWLWVAVLAVAWAPAARGESPATLLEKGYYKEQAAGDLDGAIRIYRRIIDDAKANRRYVAEAHLRLGLCLLKKGREAEAAGAFRTVIEKYPDRAKLAARARRHMPSRPFPELVGARLRETVRLKLTGKATEPAGRRTIYQGSLVKVTWRLAAGLAAKTQSLAVGLRSKGKPAAKADSYVLTSGVLAGSARNFEFGKGAAKLAPGEYVLTVFAYRAPMKALVPSLAHVSASIELTVKPLMRSQIQFYDLQPDGTLRFRSVGQRINTQPIPLAESLFMNSDFVHVERMLDEAGEPVKFTTTHRRGAYHYRVTFKRPIPPGDPVLLATEGRMTGRIKSSGSVHAYHMRHTPGGNEPVRRVEVYRLPPGAELIETTPPTMARRVRDGRTELFVEKIIPVGGSITTAFRYRLATAAEPMPRLPQEVITYMIGLHMAAVGQASAKGLPANTHVYGADDEGNFLPGGFLTYRNTTGRVITGEVPLGNFSKPDLELIDDTGQPAKFRMAKRDTAARGKYRLWWTPSRPVQPGEVRLLGWINRTVKKLPATADGYRIKMNNHFGSPVLENFFLVVPAGARLVKPSRPHISRKRVGLFDVYLWQRQVPARTTNTVEVFLQAGRIDQAPTTVPAAPPKASKLEIGPAPWADGEVMPLVLKTKTGVNIGMITYTARMLPKKGRPAATRPAGHFWRVEGYMVVPMQNLRQFTRVDADLTTFAPILGRTKGLMGDFTATYKPGKVLLDIRRKGKSSKQTYDLDKVAYDNEQALYLIRRLPLRVGYEASFPIFTVQAGATVECRIRVVAKEKAAWVGGEMDCHKVVLSIHSQGIKALEHTLWFSADKHRRLVRYDAGTADMVLLGPGRASGKPTTIKPTFGLALSLPPGTHGYADAQAGEGKTKFHILPPELAYWSVFMSGPAPTGDGSLRDYAEDEARRVGAVLKDYKVRKDGWSARKLLGRPAASYVADYTADDGAMVEYRTYVRAESKVYWFVFRIEKDRFAATKTIFDTIVDSLKIHRKRFKRS